MPADRRVTCVTIEHAIERIQFAYPQIYFACHTRHQRKRSTSFRVSRTDVEILVHLDTTTPTSLTSLASHMGLAVSTMSEAVGRLETHGYVSKQSRTARDRRYVALTLTTKGKDAVLASSVLEPPRLAAMLKRLSVIQRREAVTGLLLLASACRDGGARPRS